MNWIRAMVLEVFAILGVILLQIFGLFWQPKFRATNFGTPILLVHGYINTSAIWLYLKWKIKHLGPIYTITLKPPFTSIEAHAEQMDKMATLIEKETLNKNLILVGYSMGGLVSAYYATKLAPKNKVQKIISISSPFAGTQVAKIAIGTNANQMRIGSMFLTKINDEINNSKIPLFTIASKTDEIVIPYSSALLENSKQFIFNDLGHAGLIFSPRIAATLTHLIEA
ncbi:MAG TPA: alpha/beta fold hydrolase [Chlamydiales bacterium]|nr:alpha/beta fold hydrolase [Chlamydiales bacterium]